MHCLASNVVYMGALDVERQAPNVLDEIVEGLEIVPVTSGTSTLKDAMNEAQELGLKCSDAFP